MIDNQVDNQVSRRLGWTESLVAIEFAHSKWRKKEIHRSLVGSSA
jgi:hypothetical protein